MIAFRPHPPRLARSCSAIAAAAVLSATAVTTADARPPRGATALRRATNVSSNWAGYAVTGRRAFTRVTARWTQPAASCRAGQSSYSAFWIGLGGFRRSAQKLEQVGTDVDCTRRGTSANYAWYELVPADPVNLRLAVAAGDTIAASVSASGTRVSVRIADLTSGRSVSRTLHMSAPDTSSAEWIAEAPSQCSSSGDCHVLPLTDFGTVNFSHAAVSSAALAGSIAPTAWTTTRIELRDDALSFGGDGFGVRSLLASALPSPLLDAGRAFTVNWQSVTAPTPPNAPGSAGPPA